MLSARAIPPSRANSITSIGDIVPFYKRACKYFRKRLIFPLTSVLASMIIESVITKGGADTVNQSAGRSNTHAKRIDAAPLESAQTMTPSTLMLNRKNLIGVDLPKPRAVVVTEIALKELAGGIRKPRGVARNHPVLVKMVLFRRDGGKQWSPWHRAYLRLA